jgi:hypothetical protein
LSIGTDEKYIASLLRPVASDSKYATDLLEKIEAGELELRSTKVMSRLNRVVGFTVFYGILGVIVFVLAGMAKNLLFLIW